MTSPQEGAASLTPQAGEEWQGYYSGTIYTVKDGTPRELDGRIEVMGVSRITGQPFNGWVDPVDIRPRDRS